MKRLILHLFLLFLSCRLHADPISFSDLQNLSTNENVQIRGFLYETHDKKLILASTPNIKSCCIEKLDYQIYVFGLSVTPPLRNAITLEGKLSISNEFGIRRYQLDNATLIPEKRSSILTALLTVIVVLIIVRGIILLYKSFLVK